MVKEETSTGQSRRRFDRAAALEAALTLFWRNGYEATSMAELLKAMAINAPSLYATFGNKEKLFMEAVEEYATTYSALLYRSLEEPITAREAVERMLLKAAEVFSTPEHPAGCFYVAHSAAISESSVYIADQLRKRRHEKEAAIRGRLTKAVAEGELPATTDPARLAKFFNAVMQGISTQSRDGATLTELQDVAKSAMGVWPTPS